MIDALTKRTSFVELFFDLVFVFAITQVATAIHADHSASGWLHRPIRSTSQAPFVARGFSELSAGSRRHGPSRQTPREMPS